MYKYYLTIGATEYEVSPNFPDSQTKEYDLESNEIFFRETMSQKFKLLGADFDLVNDAPFEQKFLFRVEYLARSGTVANYFNAFFFKSDCFFDEDDRRVEISELTAIDGYSEVISGLDKEFNLINLAPEAGDVVSRKRPIIQVYIKNGIYLSSYYGGNVSDQEIIIDPVDDHAVLTTDYFFARGKRICKVEAIPDAWGVPSIDVTGDYDPVTRSNGTYTITDVTSGGDVIGYEIRRNSDSAVIYKTQNLAGGRGYNINTLRFSGVLGGVGATGYVYAAVYDIYIRYLTGLEEVRGVATYPRPVDDIVDGFENYKRVIGFNIDNFVHFEDLEEDPTPLGNTVSLGFIGSGVPVRYYKELLFPVFSGLNDPHPICKGDWGFGSIWIAPDTDLEYTEFIDGEDITLKTNYKLDSCIQVLLAAIGSDLTFLPDIDHSIFLYGASNPINGGFYFQDFDSAGILEDFTGQVKYWITPKSNVIVASSSRTVGRRGATGFVSATIAKITLRSVLNMLRQSMRLFWYIEDGKLKLEHIRYFQNGGSYPISARNIIDLTTLIERKTGKPWSYNKSKFSYKSSDMPERIEYSWMEQTTIAFQGYPINILSQLVSKGFVEKREIGDFNPDYDLIVMNEVSLDGFFLMATVEHDDLDKIPFAEIHYEYNKKIIVQNPFFSVMYLVPNFGVFDLPWNEVMYNGLEESLLNNIHRNKIQENVKFPSELDPDWLDLVETEIGQGEIKKISVNLSSRIVTVTLNHDTE